jgi:hypothetical protein
MLAPFFGAAFFFPLPLIEIKKMTEGGKVHQAQSTLKPKLAYIDSDAWVKRCLPPRIT